MLRVHILAGPNGAGKTTAAKAWLPGFLQVREFVNADEIARGLSPFHPEGVAFQAGRIMLTRLHELAATGTDFAFETTLSTRSYAAFIKDLHTRSYTVSLYFLYLADVDTALARVANRVRQGGHNIPPEVVRRRYRAGLSLFFQVYRNLVDDWRLYDNTEGNVKPIAEGGTNKDKLIFNLELWNALHNPPK